MDDHDMPENASGIKSASKPRPHEVEPWYKRYARDFYEDTRDLTLEERGAYNDIIDLIYMAGGPVRDDAAAIAHRLYIDKRKWIRIRGRLLAVGKLFITRGQLMNKRAREILDRRELERRSMGARGVARPELHPDLFENSNDFNGNLRASSTDQDQEIDSDKDRSFKFGVIDGGKARPRHVLHDVSEDALDKVRSIAPGWDRQMLRRKFLDWPGSRNATNMDKAFLGWVKKFTKGKTA